MKWLLIFCLPFFSAAQTNDTMTHNYTYLALGDSYTIGEGVPLHKNFPYQTITLLREAGYYITAPEIIAKTGWTTDELEDSIKTHQFLPKYDFVSLLIGVNNQYRGRDIMQYKEQFEHLLQKSIELAGGRHDRVIVISIPDYAVTPFGQRLNVEKISKEIDEYNALNRAISIQYKVQYLEITEDSRMAKTNVSLLAADGLHPSEKEYAKWAKKMVSLLKKDAKTSLSRKS